MNTSIFHLEWLLNNETARSVSDLDRLSPKYAYKGHGKSFPIRMPKFSLTHQALSLYLSLSLSLYIYIYIYSLVRQRMYIYIHICVGR